MNILLFEEQELNSDNILVVSDHRASYLIENLAKQQGDRVKLGQINGKIGECKIVHISDHSVSIAWNPTIAPPPAIDCTVILALPRPKMMDRIIQTLSSLGIKQIHIINTWKVEKSYWASPKLEEKSTKKSLLLGLSQSVDTVVPEIHFHRLFRPFVEDIAPNLCANRKAMVAHPYEADPCPVDVRQPSLIAIGPEGGFTDYEVGKLNQAGLSSVHIGTRILRTEVAVPVLLSRLYPA